MRNNKKKNVRSLKLLLIGHLILVLSLVCELHVIYEPLIFFSLLAIIGLFVTLFGIIRLGFVNKFFLASFLCVVIIIIFSVFTGVISAFNIDAKILEAINWVISMLSKLLSMVFTFGIIRGCSKEATGNWNSRMAKIISILNFVCRVSSIILLFVAGLVSKSNGVASDVLSVISTVISVFIDMAFCYYLYKIYKLAKSKLVEN